MASQATVRKIATLSALLFSLFLAALDFSIITTAVPSVAHELHSQTAYVWIGSAYTLTSAAVAPVWGRLSDIYGRKKALLTAIALFFAGSAFCGWSKTIAQLIAARAIQGSAAGGLIVLVNISISDLWDARHRGFFLATTGLVWAISAGVGPLLGGIFAQYLTWRWAFWINLPSSLAAFAVLMFTLRVPASARTTADEGKKMDWIGAISIVGLTVMILLSLDFGGIVSHWNSPKVLGLLLGGLVLFAAFISWEAKGSSNPIIPLHLLSSLPKAAPLLVCFAHGFVNMSSWYFLPLFFQACLLTTPTRSGILLIPIVAVQALVGLFAGYLISRFHHCLRPLIYSGMALTTLGFSLFILLSTSTPLTATIAIEIIAAFGVGAVFQAPLLAYQSAVSAADMAVATALFGFVRSLSTSISVVMGGIVFQNGMAHQARYLQQSVGIEVAKNFTAQNAAANVVAVQFLRVEEQVLVKQAYLVSLRYMWAMYAGVGGLGLMAALFVREQTAAVERGDGGGDGSEAPNTGVELERSARESSI